MSKIKEVKSIELPNLGDDRGNMSVVDDTCVPFNIKRMFYIYGTKEDAIRGQHANINSSFFMVCMAGSVTIKVKDDQAQEAIFVLDSPTKALYIPNMTWKDMYDFSPETVLVVLSDHKYDATEYIRDIESFLQGGK